MSPSELARFEEKTVRSANGCLEWTAAKRSGYGVMRRDEEHDFTVEYAHRLAYEHYVGPIPEGLTIDHLCRNRACADYAHLEPVTRGENVLRGHTRAGENLRKTHCHRGHPLTGENLSIRGGKRHCRTCARIQDRNRRPRHGTRAA